MHAVIRTFSGAGAKKLLDLLEARTKEVEGLIRPVKGFVELLAHSHRRRRRVGDGLSGQGGHRRKRPDCAGLDCKECIGPGREPAGGR